MVIALLAALFFLWAFVRWNARRARNDSVAPIDRRTMERGFKPEGVVKWQAYLGVGAMAGILAFMEWRAPSRPPFSGRLSGLKSLAFEALGGNGLVTIYIAVAVVSSLAGLVILLGARR